MKFLLRPPLQKYRIWNNRRGMTMKYLNNPKSIEGHSRELFCIKVNKEDIKFSGGHFTIFDKSHRERLHGHNFHVSCSILCEVLENGMSIDYRLLKEKLRKICLELDEYLLIPTMSKHLKIGENSSIFDKAKKNLDIEFGEDLISVPSKDVKLLPIENVTCEELSKFIGHQLQMELASEINNQVHYEQLSVEVSSGSGQSVLYYCPNIQNPIATSEGDVIVPIKYTENLSIQKTKTLPQQPQPQQKQDKEQPEKKVSSPLFQSNITAKDKRYMKQLEGPDVSTLIVTGM